LISPMEKTSKPRLVLIPGGLGLAEPVLQGPIDRLGLRDRYPFHPPRMIWILVGTKLVLLTALAYLVFG